MARRPGLYPPDAPAPDPRLRQVAVGVDPRLSPVPTGRLRDSNPVDDLRDRARLLDAVRAIDELRAAGALDANALRMLDAWGGQGASEVRDGVWRALGQQAFDELGFIGISPATSGRGSSTQNRDHPLLDWPDDSGASTHLGISRWDLVSEERNDPFPPSAFLPPPSDGTPGDSIPVPPPPGAAHPHWNPRRAMEEKALRSPPGLHGGASRGDFGNDNDGYEAHDRLLRARESPQVHGSGQTQTAPETTRVGQGPTPPPTQPTTTYAGPPPKPKEDAGPDAPSPGAAAFARFFGLGARSPGLHWFPSPNQPIDRSRPDPNAPRELPAGSMPRTTRRNPDWVDAPPAPVRGRAASYGEWQRDRWGGAGPRPPTGDEE